VRSLIGDLGGSWENDGKLLMECFRFGLEADGLH